MTRFGSAHPLDADLADLADGLLDVARAEHLEDHLADCALCRVKRLRLLIVPASGTDGRGMPSPAFVVPAVDGGAEPAAAELWLAAGDDDARILVLVLRSDGDRALVAPVTLDVEAADDEAVVVDAGHSPLGIGIVVHPALVTDVPRTVLAGRVATPGLVALDGPGVTRGSSLDGDTDPRLELRQHLADRLGSLEATPPDLATVADAPPARPEQARSALIADLRTLRGRGCAVRARVAWSDLVRADGKDWEPLVTVDEVGVVLVVFDTPHGLVDEGDFDAARSVLTRYNANALVVLARGLSELAEVFDASALNHGIDIPSGAHTPPRPLIAGLAPLDAVAKYLDQHSGARAMDPPTRGPVTHVDVAGVLREAATAAVADAVRQGGRFKIVPKRRGYESLADVPGALGAVLGQAFAGGPVVDDLLRLADHGDEAGA